MFTALLLNFCCVVASGWNLNEAKTRRCPLLPGFHLKPIKMLVIEHWLPLFVKLGWQHVALSFHSITKWNPHILFFRVTFGVHSLALLLPTLLPTGWWGSSGITNQFALRRNKTQGTRMVIGYSLAEYTCYHIDRIFIISLLHKFNSYKQGHP